MELLAPAGGWEQLHYAIRFGADAVYLATDKFGMRARAENFSLDELPSVVAYAHDRGVAVHVTCNTQMYERDMDTLARYVAAVDDAGADAILVGDLGALSVVRTHAPRVAVHVSTQASVSNVQAARTWHELGASRIVCAREMSLADIASMRQALPKQLQIEAFVHGSMCMAVSGRCLISDYLTGRSGVAGNCAQPCRWKYALQEETRPGEFFPVEEDERGSYIMNAKDLCMLGHLDALRDAGIDSIKIEGRNKKAFYVATVVNAYRQVLDGAEPSSFASELDTVSHRPYSTGFYFGPAHQTPEDDRYVREYNWAVEVVECLPIADEGKVAASSGFGARDAGALACASANSCEGQLRYRVLGLCRNRFAEGDELEVLSPHQPIRRCVVANLRYEGEDPDRTGFSPAADVFPGPVRVANRTMERYSFELPFCLHPHDILRGKRKDGETGGN